MLVFSKSQEEAYPLNLANLTDLPVTIAFCTLVEHPGGHDGGEFPQYHEYALTSNGDAIYSTSDPCCPNDSFSEEEAEYEAYNKEDALAILRERLEFLKDAVTRVEALVVGFEKAENFDAVNQSEDEDEDLGDEDEDLGDEDEDLDP